MSSVFNQGSDVFQLVSFLIGKEEFGADILSVREIIRPTTITSVPQAPSFIEGIINLRGHVVPVVDLRKRFGMEASEQSQDSRIIVVELGSRVVGFMVDAVSEVIRIDRSITEPPPELVSSIEARYITGVAKLNDRLLILLDLEQVLQERELEEMEPEPDEDLLECE